MTSLRATLKDLQGPPADLLVIGGGATGAGIARDAAMRGLRTVLVEQNDLASGTSSRSSRLIHGGLRYLEQGNLHLVFEASRERRILLDTAPHLVRPLGFLFPVQRHRRGFLLRLAAGMWLYDALALFRNVRGHRMLGKRAALKAEPALRARDLAGAARYYDAQCDDARLVVATARSAQMHGALIATYMRVERLEIVDARVRGARVVDHLSGERGLVQARTVVNATGPWTDIIRRLEFPQAEPLLRPTKGAHVVVRRERVGNHGALTLTSPIDGRIMFVLPWGDLAIIGTTDTDSSLSPDDIPVEPADVVYLLRSANAYFPNARLTDADVVATYAGLRPLLAQSGKSASQVSREHHILQGPSGMWTIAGGKLTTYRRMAQEMVDRVVRELRRTYGVKTPVAPCRTEREPLPGGEARDLGPFRQVGLELGLDPRTVDHIVAHFGTEAAAVYNLIRDDRALQAPVHPAHPALRAEIVHSTRRELPQTVADMLVRRLHLYYETPDHGAAAVAAVAELMAAELGWTPEKIGAETSAYLALIERGYP